MQKLQIPWLSYLERGCLHSVLGFDRSVEPRVFSCITQSSTDYRELIQGLLDMLSVGCIVLHCKIFCVLIM